MERSLEDRLATALANVPGSEVLKTRPTETGFELSFAEEKILSLGFEDDRWTLMAKDGHAHFDVFEEALALLTSLLRGESRFANQYRADGVHASAWIETRDDEGWAVEHQAIFLSPFDRDEWRSWSGAVWRVVRKTLRLEPEGLREETFERSSLDPLAPTRTLDALDRALGAPLSGMRWTTLSPYVVFQAPEGWRARV